MDSERGWLLLFGVIVHPALSVPVLPNVLTVNGIKVVDERGRETASIDARGEIRGGVMRGGALAIGADPLGPHFGLDSYVASNGLPVMRLGMSGGEGSAWFR
jgi:hypothetical protein